MHEILHDQIVSKVELKLRCLALHGHTVWMGISVCAGEGQHGYENFGFNIAQAHAAVIGEGFLARAATDRTRGMALMC